MKIARGAVQIAKPRVGVFIFSLLFLLVTVASAAAERLVRVGIYQNFP